MRVPSSKGGTREPTNQNRTKGLMGVNLTIPPVHPGATPADVAAEVAMWERAKREQPGLCRLLLGLIENRDGRVTARFARPCEVCQCDAVTLVAACGNAWLCDWCLAAINAIAKRQGSAA